MITSQWEAVEVLALAGVETAEATLQRMNTDHITEVIEKMRGGVSQSPFQTKSKNETQKTHITCFCLFFIFLR